MPSVPYSGQGIEGLAAIPMGGLVPEEFEKTIKKGAANGYAPLDANAKVPSANLPDANALESEAIAFAVALG